MRLRVPFAVLDLATVDEFRRWVSARIPADDGVDVLFDLGDVDLLMAAGVQAILDVETGLVAEGRTLGVVGAAPIVRRVLEICGLAERWLARG